MKEGWKTYKLGELIEIYDSKRVPLSSQQRALRQGPFPYYGAQGVIDHVDDYLFDGDFLLIAEDGNNVLTQSENIAQIARGKFWVNNHAHIVKAKINQDLLCYLINSTDISSFVTGSAQPKLSQANLVKIPITLPPSDIQDKAAAILSSLDDKIELNNRINANLEAQAQALFKSWFIDFEPFKDGEFVDSELGRIPKGWKVMTLKDVCSKITDGSHFSPKDNKLATIPMLSVKDMESHGFNYSTCKHITEEDYAYLLANDCVPKLDDILVAKDGSYMKELFICNSEIKQAILSSIAIFRPNKQYLYPEYLLFFLKTPQVLKDVKENYVSGSAVPRIVLKDFKKLPMLIPPIQDQKSICTILNSIRIAIFKNNQESQRLAQIRDAMLPRLMSGEIEV